MTLWRQRTGRARITIRDFPISESFLLSKFQNCFPNLASFLFSILYRFGFFSNSRLSPFSNSLPFPILSCFTFRFSPIPRLSLSRSKTQLDGVEDLSGKVDSFLNDDKATPEQVREVADQCLSATMNLDTGGIEDLASQINVAISQLTDVDRINQVGRDCIRLDRIGLDWIVMGLARIGSYCIWITGI